MLLVWPIVLACGGGESAPSPRAVGGEWVLVDTLAPCRDSMLVTFVEGDDGAFTGTGYAFGRCGYLDGSGEINVSAGMALGDQISLETVTGSHSCVRSLRGRLFGARPDSAVGTSTCSGTTGTWRLTRGHPLPVSIGPVTAIATVYDANCVVAGGGEAYCWGLGALGDYHPVRDFPVPVASGLAFRQVTAGTHACGHTASGEGHCWGDGASGELGDGRSTSSFDPVRVAGALVFEAVATGGVTGQYGGYPFSCGLAGRRAYCWGNNLFGQAGNGTAGAPQLTPTPVSGGITFRSIVLGGVWACGLDDNGFAYCWGRNDYCQLGNGCQGLQQNAPVAVAGGLTFTTLDAGVSAETCGVASSGLAYCWGYGGKVQSDVPIPVVNGLSFTAITNGELHFCGLVPGGQAYCWGDNGVGQLGTGDFAYSDVPVPVQGGLTFTTLDAGRFHTCALTNTAVVYCWGGNGVGQLGNGTRTNSPVPVRVAGQP
jgi:hypothetical protein